MSPALSCILAELLIKYLKLHFFHPPCFARLPKKKRSYRLEQCVERLDLELVLIAKLFWAFKTRELVEQ